MDNLYNKQWFYEISGNKMGPFSEEEMVKLIKSNVISNGNLIWRNDYPDWICLESSDLKRHLVSILPPLLTRINIDNNLVHYSNDELIVEEKKILALIEKERVKKKTMWQMLILGIVSAVISFFRYFAYGDFSMFSCLFAAISILVSFIFLAQLDESNQLKTKRLKHLEQIDYLLQTRGKR